MRKLISLMLIVTLSLCLTGCDLKSYYDNIMEYFYNQSNTTASTETTTSIEITSSEVKEENEESSNSKSSSSKESSSKKDNSSKSNSIKTKKECDEFEEYADEIPWDYSYTGLFEKRYVREYTFEDSISGYSLPYCLILPKKYDKTKKYPVLLYLHGAGARGKDAAYYLNTMLEKMYYVSESIMNNAIVIAPQCPKDDW